MKALRPNSMCGTCAFQSSGEGARENPATVLRGEIAALGAAPFRCHYAPDGYELNWRGGPIEFLKSMRSRRDYRVCAGWKARVRQLAKAGRFHERRRILHALADYAMEQLDNFIGSKQKSAKAFASRELDNALRVLRRGKGRVSR